jgi:hypothetical protein
MDYGLDKTGVILNIDKLYNLNPRSCRSNVFRLDEYLATDIFVPNSDYPTHLQVLLYHLGNLKTTNSSLPGISDRSHLIVLFQLCKSKPPRSLSTAPTGASCYHCLK